MNPVLAVRDLAVDYGVVRAVDGVSFDVHEGEILGLAGESGSGKSTIAQAVLRLLGASAAITRGQVHVDGTDVLAIGPRDSDALRAYRWRVVSLVMQSAMSALNPVLTVGEHLIDTVRAHPPWPSEAIAGRRAAELLELVGIPANRLASYPHQLSGGMRQRVGIALALALTPRLVLMDEPTTALDVVVQRALLQRVLALQEQQRFAMVFITHDLSLLLELADRVGVLYAGQMVEIGPSEALRDAPAHPYTRGLLAAIPSVSGPPVRPVGIPGSPPDPRDPPPGCRFAPRCALAGPRCRAEAPMLRFVGPGRAAACHVAS